MLTGITAVRDAESKVKIKALQQVIAEVVPFNHAKVA